MNSSVFAVRSLLAVAICSNFSSARRIGKQLPPVPTSAMPGRQPGARALHYLHLSPRSPTHTVLTQPQYVTSATKLCCQGLQIPASLPGDSWGPALACPSCSLSTPQSSAAFPSAFFCRHGRIIFQYCLAKAAPAHICFPLGDSDLKLELIKSIAPVRNAAKQWWCEENPPSERLGFRLKALIFARVREGKREREKGREREREGKNKQRKKTLFEYEWV